MTPTEVIPRIRLRDVLTVFAISAAAQAVFALLAATVLRHLGGIVGLLVERAAHGGEIVSTLSRVFSALETARIVPRVFVPFLFCLAGTALARKASRSGKKGGPSSVLRIAAAFGCVMLMIWALVLTLWLTDVNGIRFGDVLVSLLRTIRSGALDSLSIPSPEVFL